MCLKLFAPRRVDRHPVQHIRRYERRGHDQLRHRKLVPHVFKQLFRLARLDQRRNVQKILGGQIFFHGLFMDELFHDLRAFAVSKQLVDRDAEDLGDLGQFGDVGHGLPPLPVADSLEADAEPVGQLHLRHVALFAQGGYGFGYALHIKHGVSSYLAPCEWIGYGIAFL